MRSCKSTLLMPIVLLSAGVVACSGNTSPNGPSSGPSSTSAASTTSTPPTATTGSGQNSTPGTLTLRLKDSPFSDATAVLVTFSQVSIHSADTGQWMTLPFESGSSRTCDLTRLQQATDVLGVGTLAAGQYTQIRLNVTSASIYFGSSATTGSACAAAVTAPVGGTSAPVTIPSGEVKLNQEFTVPAAGATTITLDFNGDKSIHQTGPSNGQGNATPGYIMAPVIQVVSVQ
jgi:Domain of unknown function (DUF4382)